MICSRCGETHLRVGQRYCTDCHAAYMRDWRKTHDMNQGQAMRDAARHVALQAKRAGKIMGQACCVCGHANSEMHHPNHEKPHEVVWLCRDHHLAWHSFWRAAVAEIFTTWVALSMPPAGEVVPFAPASFVDLERSA